MFLEKKVNISQRSKVRKMFKDCNTVIDDTFCELEKIMESNNGSHLKFNDKESHDVE